MKILQISKYPPIQGGVSAESFWLSRTLVTLGHHVCVLTNSSEVEAAYKVEWKPEDAAFLKPISDTYGPFVFSTTLDKDHRYIPSGNPIISKLVAKGIEIIEEMKPDLIFSSYFEPYGVAGAILSLITGTSHVASHAGSDVGRLMKSPALNRAYKMILDQACAVVTSQSEQLGIPIEKCVRPLSFRLNSGLFYPTNVEKRNTFRFGIYGKTGVNKGTMELLHAFANLVKKEPGVELHALWGERELEEY